MAFFDLTKEDFLDLISKSKETVKFFADSSNVLLKNKYTLFLSNGEKLEFNIDPNNVPHLLGFKELKGLLNEKINSFDALKKIVFNNVARNSAIKKIHDLNWSYSSFMSLYYDEKLKYINEQLTAPYPNNILFVCKYNKELNIGSTDKTDKYGDCQYYIARKRTNGDILLLGFTRNDKGSYSPRTNRLITKEHAEDEIKELVNNQILCFANALYITNNITGYNYNTFLNDQDKIEILQNIKNISSSSGACVDCSEDYLKKMLKSYLSFISMTSLKTVLNNISSSIKNGELIDLDDETLNNCKDCSDEVKTLVESVNDKLCIVSKNDKTKVSYTSTLRENKKLELELKKSEALRIKQENKMHEIDMEYRNLKKEKEELEQYKRKTEKKLKLLSNENQSKKDE